MSRSHKFHEMARFRSDSRRAQAEQDRRQARPVGATARRPPRSNVGVPAGRRGFSVVALHEYDRKANYYRQNDTERLTPRQRRRVDHKARAGR